MMMVMRRIWFRRARVMPVHKNHFISYHAYIIPRHLYFFPFSAESEKTSAAEDKQRDNAPAAGIHQHIKYGSYTAARLYVHYDLCSQIGY